MLHVERERAREWLVRLGTIKPPVVLPRRVKLPAPDLSSELHSSGANDSPASNQQQQPGQQKNAGAMSDLEKLIGLSRVKRLVRDLRESVRIEQEMKRHDPQYEAKDQTLNMQFVGNPGTGKTTVARIVARALHEVGFLDSDKFTETTGAEMGRMLDSDRKTFLDQARGGVLYQLNPQQSSGGAECMHDLLRIAEEWRNEIEIDRLHRKTSTPRHPARNSNSNRSSSNSTKMSMNTDNSSNDGSSDGSRNGDNNNGEGWSNIPGMDMNLLDSAGIDDWMSRFNDVYRDMGDIDLAGDIVQLQPQDTRTFLWNSEVSAINLLGDDSARYRTAFQELRHFQGGVLGLEDASVHGDRNVAAPHGELNLDCGHIQAHENELPQEHSEHENEQLQEHNADENEVPQGEDGVHQENVDNNDVQRQNGRGNKRSMSRVFMDAGTSSNYGRGMHQKKPRLDEELF